MGLASDGVVVIGRPPEVSVSWGGGALVVIPVIMAFARLPDRRHPTGRVVGVAAVKYAGRSLDVSRDCVFELDRMVSFQGDAGPYIQYAHARIRSILEKAGIAVPFEGSALPRATLSLSETSERELALTLPAYGGVVSDVARTLEPSRLCAYLQRAANACSEFYLDCRVLLAEEPIHGSQLRLRDLTRRVLHDGLGLLGLEAPEMM